VKDAAIKDRVWEEIRKIDPSAEMDPNGDLNAEASKTAFCFDATEYPLEFEKIEGVVDVCRALDLCPCGSGERKDSLEDARGIFCCYVCSKCEDEKRSRYRVEVLEDPQYEADEQIEPEEGSTYAEPPGFDPLP
jgi:hypothetical protein